MPLHSLFVFHASMSPRSGGCHLMPNYTKRMLEKETEGDCASAAYIQQQCIPVICTFLCMTRHV
jgi:hypothetical protein